MSGTGARLYLRGMNDRLGRRGRRPLGSLLLAALVAGLLCVWVPPAAAEPEVTCERLEILSETGRPQRTLELLDETGLRCPGLRAEARALRKGARALIKLARRLEDGTPRVVSHELPAFACVDTLPSTPAKARAAANNCDHRVNQGKPEVASEDCTEVAALNDAGYPAAAEALIASLELTCAAQKREAGVRKQRAATLIAWVLAEEEDRSDELPAAPSASCAPDAVSDPKKALAGARSCDREAAKLSEATQVADPGTLTNISNHWTIFLGDLGPFWKIAAGVLLWLALGLALAKAAIAIAGNRRIGTGRSKAWWWSGLACLVAGGAVAMVAASHDIGVWPWMAAGAISLVGVVLTAEFWRTQPRLVVWSNNESAVASTAITAIARELGSQGPGGIEVPSGPDATFVDSVGLKNWSSNPAVAALAVLEDLVKPVNPWRLEVEAVDGQRIVTRLLRNRREVAGMRVFSDMELLGHLSRIPAPTGAPGLSLAAFPAAHAVMEMAKEHRQTTECAGATSSVSMALQYLGARLESTDPRRLPVFQAAVGRDAGNQTAWLSYLHDCYRDETDRDELMRYRDLLAQILPVVAGAPEEMVTEAEVRARLARLAAGINADLTAQLASEAANLETAAARLVENAGEDAAKKEFAEDCLDAATAMAASVRPPIDPPTEPDTQGAAVNYSWACYWATVEGPEDQRQVREDRAVAFLRQADADPDRKEWKRKDPQLAELRRTETYVKAFSSDFFDLPPAKARQGILGSAGLTTPAAVGGATPAHLEAVGIKGAEAEWLQELARLWAIVPTQSLGAWRGELLRVVVTAGWPPVVDPRTDMLTRLLAVVPTSKAADVTTWWNGLQPSPQP